MNELLNDEDEEAAAVSAFADLVSAASYLSGARTPGWRGRQVGYAPSIRRGTCAWYESYLCPKPTYTSAQFRRRFRVPMGLYRVLETELPAVEPRLLQGTNCAGRVGHPTFAKILNSLRRLGNGVSFQDLDDQSRMSVESQREAFTHFLGAVRTRFGRQFLNRRPSVSDLRAVQDRYSARGFPGCIGCVDCMKVRWKNCPRSLKGQFKNPKDSKLAVLSCEALVDSDLFCWHWFAGRPGTNNDVTVMDNSPLFMDILAGRRCMHLPEGYCLNGKVRHDFLYFLGDGIYPRWAIFVLPNRVAVDDKERYFSERQESTRKDVERFFGCLQGRFHILRGERHEWSDDFIVLITEVCVILHNMIVVMRREGTLAEDSDGVNLVEEFFQDDGSVELVGSDSGPLALAGPAVGLAALLERTDALRSAHAHAELQKELTEELWRSRGA